jgi:hypothetical protein
MLLYQELDGVLFPSFNTVLAFRPPTAESLPKRPTATSILRTQKTICTDDQYWNHTIRV